MPDSSQHVFRAIELDPELLSAPFRVQTNWHVITGASCSGKTTLIDLLADKGFQTFPEVGRQYFKREFAKGRTIDEIRVDRPTLTRQIYDLWIKLLRGLQAAEVTFLDRGIPDGLTFFRTAGMDPNEILPDCFKHRFASVFLLDRLPYQQDEVRAGDDETATFFESWTLRDYVALGYNVVNVPVMPPEERLAFILETLSEDGLMYPLDRDDRLPARAPDSLSFKKGDQPRGAAMKIYISGVMQGSIKGHGIQGQGYRQVISDAIKIPHPDAEIYDPFSLFPDSVAYGDKRSKEALFTMADAAGSADVVIAYLPEASMGTGLEMIRAYDNGKTIISITTLEKNWFIRAVSEKIFLSLDDFCAWVNQTNLADLIAESKE